MTRPFDAARFERLLEGLEVTVLSLSAVRHGNDKLRVDSGYYSKLAVLTHQRIERLPHAQFGDLCTTFRKGIFDIKADSYVEEGIPFVRISNLRNGLIDEAGIAYITPVAHQQEAATALKFGDLVLAKTAYPAASFVNLPACNVSQDTVAVRLSREGATRVNTGYLAAYFNGRYGKALLQQQFQGNVQEHLSLPDGRRILIPIFGDDFQQKIKDTLLAADRSQQQSLLALAKAETTLTAALGLANWQPPQHLSYTRRAAEVFSVGRFDAEHHQEKYRSLVSALKQCASGYVTLGDICPDPINGVEVREYQDDGVPYLRVGDLQNYTLKSEGVRFISPMAAASEIEKVRLAVGDVLVSRSGSLAVTGVVEESWQHSVISSHLIRCRLIDATFDPYYVAIFLGTRFGKMQIEQQSNGGVQPEINQPALKRIVIPRLSETDQADVRAHIHAAEKARREARHLLAAAQRAVEIAIEHSEAAALAHLTAAEAALRPADSAQTT